MAEALEKLLHQAGSAGIGIGQIAYVPETVGQIAASASCDGDLGEKPVPGLEYRDICSRHHSLDVHGGETACRTSSDYRRSHTFQTLRYCSNAHISSLYLAAAA